MLPSKDIRINAKQGGPAPFIAPVDYSQEFTVKAL